jgi:hypothetical protein
MDWPGIERGERPARDRLKWVKLSAITYKYPVRTAKETLSVSVTKTSQLMLYREIMAVYSEIDTKHINTLCGQNVELLNVKLAVQIVITVRYIY